MIFKKFFYIFLSAFFALGWSWKELSVNKSEKPKLKISTVWTADTAPEALLKVQLVNNSPPLITDQLAVQGGALNGVKAYEKSSGRLVWEFKIPGGAAGPLAEHKGNIYFGAADGFFYSLKLDSGRLNWKFWTGFENLGAPLIHEGRVYWTSSGENIYALNLEGRMLWMHSSPLSSQIVPIRGRPRPAVYKDTIYTGFYGGLAALDKKTGRLKWGKALAPSKPVVEDLASGRGCLFIPFFDFYLFCLNPSSGKIRWKARGGSGSFLEGAKVIYQFYKGDILALDKFTGRLIWRRGAGLNYIFPPLPYKNFLVYGSPSYGKIVFADKRDGRIIQEKTFGRGLAGPIRADKKTGELYFFSIDGRLFKLSVL